MKYLGQENDITNANTKTGVLLINLGTPDRPVCPGLRKYLGEFLMDPRVIEIPKLFRALLESRFQNYFAHYWLKALL